MKKRLDQIMYFFVLSQLSDIQKGIHAGKAALEYYAKYNQNLELNNFLFWNKQWIILETYSSNDSHYGYKQGEAEEIYNALRNNMINCTHYSEPFLNNAMTAICFLADERVWNYEKYPDFVNYLSNIASMPDIDVIKIRMSSFEENKKLYPSYYEQWLESIGGNKNLFLRNLIKDKIVINE